MNQKNKSIIILGSTGMLGYAVAKYFVEKTKYNVVCTVRNEEAKNLLKNNVNFEYSYFNRVVDVEFFSAISNEWLCESTLKDLSRNLNDDIYLINCIGLIKPYCSDVLEAIRINSEFPHVLAKSCDKLRIKLINIATDCVFTGNMGNYSESESHDPLDVYGKTKSLGESNLCMTLRTSIIGEELKEFKSLLEWVKSQKNTVNGYSNHYWNGVTTKHFAEICHQIIENNLYEEELFHIYSNSKFELTKKYLIELINKKYNLNLSVIEHKTSEKCDRRLSTRKNLINKLKIKTIEQQIEEI